MLWTPCLSNTKFTTFQQLTSKLARRKSLSIVRVLITQRLRCWFLLSQLRWPGMTSTPFKALNHSSKTQLLNKRLTSCKKPYLNHGSESQNSPPNAMSSKHWGSKIVNTLRRKPCRTKRPEGLSVELMHSNKNPRTGLPTFHSVKSVQSINATLLWPKRVSWRRTSKRPTLIWSILVFPFSSMKMVKFRAASKIPC